MNSKRLENLQLQLDQIKKKIKKEKDELYKKNIAPLLKSYEGKYFIFKDNSYSYSKNKNDYWDVYRKLIKVIFDDSNFCMGIIEDHSVDCYGQINHSITKTTINFKNIPEYIWLGWEEISEQKYDKAIKKILVEIKTKNKLINTIYYD